MPANKKNIAKLVILLIPLVVLIYLLTVNFVLPQEFNYFYEVGSEQDEAKPYLAPFNRTSDIIISGDHTYRYINYRLIYLSVPIVRGAQDLNVSLQFRTTINTTMSIGIKNNTGWNYTWSVLEIPQFQENEWSNAQKEISLQGAYPENGKLSIAIDIPKLSSKEWQNNTFSIDWINLTIYKPGVFT